MDIESIKNLASTETGLCVVAVARDDGTVHASVVNAGLIDHPSTGTEVLAFVVRGGAHKLALMRRRGRASVTFRRGWSWAGVEGSVELMGPSGTVDEVDAVDVPVLLRAIFVAAGGTHDDWAEYDRVMAAEGRTAVLLSPERILGS